MLAPPLMGDWAESPVYRRTRMGRSAATKPTSDSQFGNSIWIHSCWPSRLRRLVCNRKTRIHACWPGSLRRLDCNLNTCWQSSLRQLDCKPVTWIRLGLLVLLPSAVIKYVGLVSSMSLCNKVFYISQRSRNDLSMKGVWVVANIVNVY